MFNSSSFCTVTHDIMIEGRMAFRAGERVIIQTVSPNQQRPEYKYVVMSAKLGQRFQLREEDFAACVKPVVTKQSEETAPSDSLSAWSVVKGLFILASFLTFVILGLMWGGWLGGVIGLVIWLVIAGWTKYFSDISDMGEAARKQLGKK